MIPVASAAGVGIDENLDTDSVSAWQSAVGNDVTDFVDEFAGFLDVPLTNSAVFWRIMDGTLGSHLGEMDRDTLELVCTRLNNAFGSIPIDKQFSGLPDTMRTWFGMTLNDLMGFGTMHFEVQYPSGTAGYYRIVESVSGIPVVNSRGMYPCTLHESVSSDDITPSGCKFVPISHLNGKVNMMPYESLYNLGQDYDLTPMKYDKYWILKKPGSGVTDFVLADADGYPCVARYEEDKWASEQDRPTDKVTENGDIIEGDLIDNSVNLDLEGMTITLPDGSINFIDKIIYDESTKSYHIDSHDTYNYTINNYYTWNYYINYTSITYIGQTEEYNKYYEVYYELPDGRSSADLTKEDLEQLNLSVDVIPYGRSADDTSLRSLYHFDGDTKDSSYWNYCTDFTWNKGASLTYMDAGVFDGALYLDETEHDFTVTLPSGLGSGDFTFQFRYYQSHTEAPVTDSYIKFGDIEVMKFNGSSLLHYNGNAISAMPVGSWNEIALVRENGIVYYYLNGVQVSKDSHLGVNSFPKQITFHFGNEQQTFKYLDELRVLNKAIQTGGANYECSSVPHDTNLSLILPTESAPVADEYWNFDKSITPLWSLDFTDGTGEGVYKDSNKMGGLNYWTSRGTSFYQDGSYASLSQTTQPSGLSDSMNQSQMKTAIGMSTSGWWTPTLGFSVPLAFYDNDHNTGKYITNGDTQVKRNPAYQFVNDQVFTFTVVERSGEQTSYTFTGAPYLSAYMNVKGTYTADWGTIRQIAYMNNGYMHCVLWLNVDTGKSLDVVYMELVEGSNPNTGHEFVSSVTGIDKADLNTPTLAVRTDIDITSYQIGGVRPSLPEKGMVWAMVENERITSLQVYNGQAWEGVDGRIWTGERWIPMNSYNIITLQDLYDIVDATPNYEYIYSEAGFWAWWQKSWNAFTERLFTLLSAGGASGGGVSITPETAPAVPDNEETGEKGYNAIDLFVVLKDGTWNFITGIVGLAFDGFDGFVESVSSAGSFFTMYDEDSEESIFFIPLEEGETLWD